MLSRSCTKCGESYPLTKQNFSKDPRYSKGFKTWCRLCCNTLTRKGMKAKYASDSVFRERVKRTMREWRKAHPRITRRRRRESKDRATKFVDAYLRSHPCVDCGEAHPATLEFDHRNPHTKRFAISSRRASGATNRSLQEEISKCDVRCANCHRKRHAREYGHRTARP